MSGLFDPPESSTADDTGTAQRTAVPEPPPSPGPGPFGDAVPTASPVSAATIASYRVLARKYRPTRFEDLIGQQPLVRTLRNAFALGRVAHAFLLTGVRGVGKTTTARIIARALNCVGPDGKGGPTAEPCDVCPNCTAILAERHPDVIEMDAASRTGVDDVREIIEATRFRPMQARTKVFIVDEVHMLSRNAFNALLKTLEEPPPHVHFVFATTELRKVPVTVLSRCQRFDLRRVARAELAAHFAQIAEAEHVPVAAAAIDLIARAADGSVRDGLSLLDQAIALGAQGKGNTDATAEVSAETVADMLGLAERDSVFDLLEALMAGRAADALALTERSYALGVDVGMVLQDLLELVHTVTRLKVVPALKDSRDLPEIERTRGAAMAETLSMATLGRAWQMLLKGIGEVEQAPDRRAAAEMVLIRLCHVAELPPPAELVRRLTGKAAPSAPDAPAVPATIDDGGGRAAVNAAPMPRPAIAPEPKTETEAVSPMPRSFRDVVVLASEHREPMLHAHLTHSVHLVRFAPPIIELRTEPSAPRDLAAKLSALLGRVTGTRWTIALSAEEGASTLAAQAEAATEVQRTEALAHPLVRAVMEAFPGARIEAIHPAGITAVAASVAGDGAGGAETDESPSLEFAPPDAMPVDADDMEEDL
jgi:DNA polymerase-3 subunit gamma/tau